MLTNCNKSIQVLGPTGNSASLIEGMTIHSFLQVPCGPKAWKDMAAPVGTKAEKLQKHCEYLQCLIIDERSMVGCNLFGWAEYHLEHGKFSSEEWARIPVIIMCGSPIQTLLAI